VTLTLTFDLGILQHFGCYAFKVCTKFEQNRMIHSWVIDDLCTFSPCNFRGSVFFRGAWSQLYQTWQRHKAIIPTQEICFSVCCIFKRERLSAVVNDAKFCTFWPPVKIWEGMGEISIPIVEALPMIEPLEYIYWPSTVRLQSAVDW